MPKGVRTITAAEIEALNKWFRPRGQFQSLL